MNKSISEIFSVEYPKTMIFQNQETDPSGFPFVSSSGVNNGIVNKIKRTVENKLYKKGAITVPLKGSVLEAFYQPEDFYVAHQIAVLYPKRPMSEKELLFYCLCIKKNKFRFSYGRQADLTLKDLKIPTEIPEKFLQLDVKEPSTEPFLSKNFLFTDRKWEWFLIGNLFEVLGTKTTPKRKLEEIGPGKYPYVTTQSTNNGAEGFYDFYTEEGNVMVADSAVAGFCSYQGEKFTASDHVEKLSPKFKLNKFVGLFLQTVMNLEQFRYSYGRKFNQEKIRNTKIKLPIDKRGQPDWQFMEDYIKSLPYSGSI